MKPLREWGHYNGLCGIQWQLGPLMTEGSSLLIILLEILGFEYICFKCMGRGVSVRGIR